MSKAFIIEFATHIVVNLLEFYKHHRDYRSPNCYCGVIKDQDVACIKCGKMAHSDCVAVYKNDWTCLQCHMKCSGTDKLLDMFGY